MRANNNVERAALRNEQFKFWCLELQYRDRPLITASGFMHCRRDTFMHAMSACNPAATPTRMRLINRLWDYFDTGGPNGDLIHQRCFTYSMYIVLLLI